MSSKSGELDAETSAAIDAEVSSLASPLSQLPHARLEARLAGTIRFCVQLSPKKTLTLSCHLPAGYPSSHLVCEVRSKTLGHKLTDGLAQLAEAEAAKLAGRPQVAAAVTFVHNWVRDNPLCAAAEEISDIRSRLLCREGGDRIKLLQAESRLLITAAKDDYRLCLQIQLPNDYPDTLSQVSVADSNLPQSLRTFADSQAKEIARRCVQRPQYRGEDKKLRAKADGWAPAPAVTPIAEFAVGFLRGCVGQLCPACGASALSLPDGDQLEKVYCGHLYHLSCLRKYMTSPPYSSEKRCLHAGCGKVVYHDRFRTSARVLESRWAAQQAKERELAEVADFLE